MSYDLDKILEKGPARFLSFLLKAKASSKSFFSFSACRRLSSSSLKLSVAAHASCWSSEGSGDGVFLPLTRVPLPNNVGVNFPFTGVFFPLAGKGNGLLKGEKGSGAPEELKDVVLGTGMLSTSSNGSAMLKGSSQRQSLKGSSVKSNFGTGGGALRLLPGVSEN